MTRNNKLWEGTSGAWMSMFVQGIKRAIHLLWRIWYWGKGNKVQIEEPVAAK